MIYKHIITLITILCIFTTSITAEEKAFVDAGTSSNIEPKDGTWKPKITSNKVKGCPPMMSGAIEGAKMNTSTKKVTFSKPFHPNDLFDPKDINPENNPNAKWKNPSENYWKVTIINNQQGASVTATWDVKVTTETTMDVTSYLSMKFPPEMAKFMGGSSECRVESSGIIERIGN